MTKILTQTEIDNMNQIMGEIGELILIAHIDSLEDIGTDVLPTPTVTS